MTTATPKMLRFKGSFSDHSPKARPALEVDHARTGVQKLYSVFQVLKQTSYRYRYSSRQFFSWGVLLVLIYLLQDSVWYTRRFTYLLPVSQEFLMTSFKGQLMKIHRLRKAVEDSPMSVSCDFALVKIFTLYLGKKCLRREALDPWRCFRSCASTWNASYMDDIVSQRHGSAGHGEFIWAIYKERAWEDMWLIDGGAVRS